MAIQQNFAAFTPSLNLNFARSKKLDPRVTFGRSSKATRMNEEGLIEVVGNNVPRFDHTYDASTGTIRSLGLLIEESRTNQIRNNTMIGAAVGTFPTYYGAINRSGLTFSITGTGIDSGVNYIDLRLSGTSNATSSPTFTFEASDQISASNGQTWTTSCYIKLVSGTLSGITNIGLAHDERLNTYLTGGRSSNFLSSISSSTSNIFSSCRYSFTRTNTNSSTATLLPYLIITPSNGAVIDMTLRIGMPQTELGAFVTSVIPTAGLETPRALELATMTGTNFSSWYNQLEGTYLISTKIAHSPNPNVSMFFRTLNTAGQRVSIEQVPGNTLQFLVENTGGSYSFAPPAGGILGNDQFRKTGLTYISTNGTTTVAGASNLSVSADTTSTRDVVKDMNRLNLGRYTDTLYFLNGHIQQFIYYPRKLTNSQLQQLTR